MSDKKTEAQSKVWVYTLWLDGEPERKMYQCTAAKARELAASLVIDCLDGFNGDEFRVDTFDTSTVDGTVIPTHWTMSNENDQVEGEFVPKGFETRFIYVVHSDVDESNRYAEYPDFESALNDARSDAKEDMTWIECAYYSPKYDEEWQCDPDLKTETVWVWDEEDDGDDGDKEEDEE